VSGSLVGRTKTLMTCFAACIDERRHILSAENVQAGANQGESLIRKILNRRDKRELAVEPRLDGVLVRRNNIRKVAGFARSETWGVD